MALWKESTAPAKEAPSIMTPPAEPAFKREPEPSMDIAPQAPRRVAPREAKESVVAAEITITGKIVGAGHVRIAGRFEGDVQIEGNLTIEQGAKITGGIRANSVNRGRGRRQHRARRDGRAVVDRRDQRRCQGGNAHRRCRLAYARTGGVRLD